MGPVFAARREGTCEECGFEWDEGDSIRFNNEDELVHEDCAEDEARQYRNWAPSGAGPDARDRRHDHG